MAGHTLGAYRVLDKLGEGGMGEVYRARDSRLDRDVALKILPPGFADDPERLARFEREAKTLAALNHPHIAQIYGFERSGGTAALVMELVEGEDLSQHIARGPVPRDEALAIAAQIADALEAAHERGIVHRDLKPANVKLRRDGTVKVLDFGLAKPLLPALASEEYAQTQTAAAPLTHAGFVIGTAPYMSPEQARGLGVDKRADVWAFGCVLYELLTARRAFAGDTAVETMAAVIEREPDWDVLPPSVPFGLRSLLQRCLAKDVRQRTREIADVRLEIEALQRARLSEVAPPHRERRKSWAVPLAAAALLVGLLAGGLAARWLAVPPAHENTRFTLTLAADEALGAAPGFALSPDGRRLVYVRVQAGSRRLFLRELTSFEPTALPGTDDAQQPFFSPDGRSIGFFAQAKLKRIGVSGGAPVTLADAVNPRGGAWGTSDTILFAPNAASVLLEVPAGGGAVREVTRLDRARGEGGHRWPAFLPDGKTIVFAAGPATTHTSWSEARIVLMRLASGERVDLVPRGTYPRYVNGSLFYVEAGTLLMRLLDVSRPEAAAESVAVVDQVAQGGSGGAQVAFSSTGTLAYATGARPRPEPLVWVDRAGVEEPLPIAPGVYSTPRLSPDGRRIAVTVAGTNTDVWVHDLDRGTATRLTFAGGNLAPLWTPDGTRVTLASNRQGASNVFWTSADGGGELEQLTTTDTIHLATSWAPAGDVLLVTSVNTASNTDVLALERRSGRLAPLILTPFAEERAVFSPDGRWIAHVSNDSERSEVYVRASAGGERRWQVSLAGGTDPVWARSGRELFYRQENDMMAVDVSTAGAMFTSGRPRKLFTARHAGGVVASYDVSADGRRFLMVRAPTGGDTREIRVALRWLDEVTQARSSPASSRARE